MTALHFWLMNQYATAVPFADSFCIISPVAESPKAVEASSEAEEFLNRLKAVQADHLKPHGSPGNGGGWHKSVAGWLGKLWKRRAPHPDPSIRHLENQEELIKWLRLQAKLLTPLYSFGRGIATGLGFVIGTTLVLSVLLAILGKLSLVPIVGQFAKDILDYIGTAHQAGQ